MFKPTITLKRIFAGASGSRARPATSVAGVFHNEEDVGVYGIATATVKTQTATYTNASARTYFPPHEDITVTIIVEGVAFYEQNPACFIDLSEVDNIACPDCDGTGVTSVSDCPDCAGTGFVNCPLCGGSLIDGGGGQKEDVTDSLAVDGAIVGVGVFAAVAIAAVIVLKRKKVTEKDLRKLPPNEFQNWVLKRLAGKSPSLRDSRMGIDGYTIEGQPVSIKQSDGIGRNVIENFAAAMGRSKAKNGIIVAFSFGGDAYTGKVKAKLNYGLEIQMVTVKDLIEGRKGAF